jgi:hypothetical protein
MNSIVIRCCITLVAVAMIAVRFIRPDIKFDTTLVVLIVIGIVPWVASVLGLKALELPGGFKFEFKDEATRRSQEISAAVEPPHQRPKDEPTTGPEEIPAAVQTPQRLPEGPSPTGLADAYIVRVAKFTPIETITAYLVTDRVLASSFPHPVKLQWAVVLLFLFATPVYLRFLGVTTRQILISTAGFVAWVAALGGPLVLYHWYQPMYGALALVLFAYGAPLFDRG